MSPLRCACCRGVAPPPCARRHCSLLLKPVWGGNSTNPTDLLFAHTSWFGYESMTRMHVPRGPWCCYLLLHFSALLAKSGVPVRVWRAYVLGERGVGMCAPHVRGRARAGPPPPPRASFKRYNFPLTLNGTSGTVPSTSISLSGYPATLCSYDDWLQTSAGLSLSGALSTQLPRDVRFP
jgi:hypothetical protein